MVNDDAALCHHFFEVTQAQLIRQIPADTLRDEINGVMQASEGVPDQSHGQVISQKNTIITRPRLNATEPFFLPNLTGVTDDNSQHGIQNVQCIIQRQRLSCKDKGNQYRGPFLRSHPGDIEHRSHSCITSEILQTYSRDCIQAFIMKA